MRLPELQLEWSQIDGIYLIHFNLIAAFPLASAPHLLLPPLLSGDLQKLFQSSQFPVQGHRPSLGQNASIVVWLRKWLAVNEQLRTASQPRYCVSAVFMSEHAPLFSPPAPAPGALLPPATAAPWPQ